ncbi:hypothetical protein EVAR_37984_1 [Eumeta japonica]|uniref:Uncharacterized protein n=1 Tax=Eumeta variegata TaxID=151549 RepID=A0A4C1YVG8_EUMVA|nr:hypothetical protein EVAR_37984_1 [Eumeta japonica]
MRVLKLTHPAIRGSHTANADMQYLANPHVSAINDVINDFRDFVIKCYVYDIDVFEIKITCVVFDFPENLKAIRVVAVENAKEFSDVSDFILNINNKTCLWETTRLLPQQKKRVQKVWSNKQKVIIIVNPPLTYYLESVSSDNALFEFEDSSDLLQWLENCTDPWDTVESHWIRTAGTRLKLVKTLMPQPQYI